MAAIWGEWYQIAVSCEVLAYHPVVATQPPRRKPPSRVSVRHANFNDTQTEIRLGRRSRSSSRRSLERRRRERRRVVGEGELRQLFLAHAIDGP